MAKNNVNKTFSIEERNFFLRRLFLDELDHLTNLFNNARNRKLNYTFFKKKYDTQWTGLENVAIVVLDEQNRVVGHLGVLPTPILINGQHYLSGQISDAVLDHKLRGKNVFEEIIKELEKLSASTGISFLWVAPSPQAIKGFNVNQWTEMNYLKTYTFKVKTLPLNKISNKFNLGKIYLIYVRFVLFLLGAKRHSFENPNFSMNQSGVAITPEYIKHKNYTENYLSQLGKFTCWFKIEDGLEIGNVEHFSLDQKNHFFKKMSFVSRCLGCHQYKIVTTSGTFLDALCNEEHPLTGNKIFVKNLTNEPIMFDHLRFNGSDLNTF
jgi:hypothetical protein